MRTWRALFVLALSMILLGGNVSALGRGEKHSPEEKPTVALSILPQLYFVQRIAGDMLNAVVLVGEGQSPHTYEPTPSQMAALARAKVWVLSGTDFEDAIVSKISSLYPNLILLDGTQGVSFRTLEEHDHDHEHNTVEGDSLERDRHTWLGWQSSKILAAHVLEAAVLALPENQQELQKRYEALIAEIDETFLSLKIQLAPLAGSKVFVYHPSFGYFFDEFAITQEAVEVGGKEPTARDLSNLIQKAKDEQAVALFVQKQFPVASAQTVAKAAGAKVLALDPLSSDWMENIKVMGEALLSTIGEKR